MINCNKKTTIRFFDKIRCRINLFMINLDVKIGGIGIIVQADEGCSDINQNTTGKSNR